MTALITAFNRPRSLERCYRSIRRFHPALPIMVVDTGEQSADLPNDSLTYRQRGDLRANVSAARNAAIAECRTEFVWHCDDDFELTADVLPLMLDVLTSDPAISVVTGNPINHGTTRVEVARDMVRRGDDLRLIAPRRPASTTPGGTRYQPCDLGWCFILARRDGLPRWDESIPINVECYDWFLELQRRGLGVAMCPAADFAHWPGGDAEYTAQRGRHFLSQLCAKWGFRRIIA